MKLRQILFALSILVATALIAVFVYELLWSLDTANFGNFTNSIANSNQLAARDVQNISSNLTHNNVTFPSSTDTLNNPGTLAVTIIFSSLAVILTLAGGYSLLVFYEVVPLPGPKPRHAQAIVEAGAGEFLNQ